MKVTALIVAAGKSVRFGSDLPKQFHELNGRPLLSWTISRFEEAESIEEIVVVVADDQLELTAKEVIGPFSFQKVSGVVCGGESRQESVLRGLESLSPETGLVAIHDGARPLVSPIDINNVVNAAQKDGAAMLASKVRDTVKRVSKGQVAGTLARENLFFAQTPQVFKYAQIFAAHKANRSDHAATDDAYLLEKDGTKIIIIEPTQPNPKITTEQEMRIAQALLNEETDD